METRHGPPHRGGRHSTIHGMDGKPLRLTLHKYAYIYIQRYLMKITGASQRDQHGQAAWSRSMMKALLLIWGCSGSARRTAAEAARIGRRRTTGKTTHYRHEQGHTTMTTSRRGVPEVPHCSMDEDSLGALPKKVARRNVHGTHFRECDWRGQLKRAS